jgi:serine/threonine-protein kinase
MKPLQHTHLFATMLASCLLAAPAIAQTLDKSAAVTLFDEAQQLMEAGRYAEACPKYAESNRLDAQLGVLLHLADCYEKTGKLASAWVCFRDAADLADRRADERSLTAKQRAQALESRLSRLTVTVPQAADVTGLEVRRDGALLTESLWGVAIPVDSGRHTITATAPGKRSGSVSSTSGITVSGRLWRFRL